MTIRDLTVRIAFLLCIALRSAGAEWYVDNAAAAAGDGSAATPFRTIAEAVRASSAGDTILLRPGNAPYRESLTLQGGQTLAGSGGTPEVVATGSPAITLAGGTRVRNVIVRGSGGNAAIIGESVDDVRIESAHINVSGGADAIVLRDPRGITISDTQIRGEGAGAAVVADRCASAAVVYESGTIEMNRSSLVVATSCKGSVTFGKDVAILAAAAPKDAVLISDSEGIRFEGALSVSSEGAAAVVIRDSRGVFMRGARLRSVRAGALSVVASEVDLEIADLDVDGAGAASEGVSVRRMTGRLIVSGGTVKNIAQRGVSLHGAENVTLMNVTLDRASLHDGEPCGRPTEGEAFTTCNGAVYLRDVRDIRFRNVKLSGSAQHGIVGDAVRNLEIADSVVVKSGDEIDESGLMLRDVTGSLKIAASAFRENASRQIELTTTGELELRLDRVQAGPAPEETRQQGLLFTAAGEARVRASVHESNFTGLGTSGVHGIAANAADVEIMVAESSFANSGSAVVLATSDDARLSYDLSGNEAGRHSTTAITVTSASSVGARGSLTGNRVGKKGEASSGASCNGGCAAIAVTGGGDGSSRTVITDNVLFGSDVAVRLRSADRGTLDAIVTGNTIGERAGGSNPAIVVQAGARPKDSARTCVELGGSGALANRIAWADPASGIQLIHRFPLARFDVAGFAGSPTAVDQMRTFVASRNIGATVTANISEPLSISERCGDE